MKSTDELERRLASWAAGRTDIRTMMVAGSRARADTADEWADLDVVFTTTALGRYQTTTDWLYEIGDVWVAFVDREGKPRHGVVFSGGISADLVVLRHGGLRIVPPVLRARERFPRVFRLLPGVIDAALDRQVRNMFSYRPTDRLLVDKDGSAASAIPTLPLGRVPAPLPTADEFRAVVHEFWYQSIWNAKHLRRGALWSAKTNRHMKMLLLRMIGWHAHAINGAVYETCEDGRQIEEWAEPRVLEGLRFCFAHYDEDDLWRASLATMDLFRTVATETADRLGFSYPTRADAGISEWVSRCEAERAAVPKAPGEG